MLSGSGYSTPIPASSAKASLSTETLHCGGCPPAWLSAEAEIMPSEGPFENVDVYLPLPLGADAVNRRGDENCNILVRLKPGVTVSRLRPMWTSLPAASGLALK